MKKIILVVLSLLLISCRISEKNSDFDEKEIINLYSNTWRAVKNFYGHNDQVDNWDENYQNALIKALECEDIYGQWEIYEEFLSTLNDAHLQIIDKNNYLIDAVGYLPITFEWIENGYYVTSKSRNENIKLFSKLIKINDINIDTYLENFYANKVTGYSEIAIKDKYIERFCYDEIGKEVDLTFVSLDGDEFTKKYEYNKNNSSFYVKEYSYFSKIGENIINKVISDSLPIRAYELKNKIIYLNIQNFKDGTSNLLKEVINQYPASEYKYIVDIRNNTGASGDEVVLSLELLAETEIEGTGFKEAFVVSDGYYMVGYNRERPNTGNEKEKMYNGIYHSHEISENQEPPLYDGDNLVVLIDRNTTSSGEYFAAIAKRMNIPIIGENTKGALGGSIGTFNVLDGLKLLITVGRLEDLNGNTYLSGVSPDFEITQSIEDYKKEIDTVLMYAIEAFNE